MVDKILNMSLPYAETKARNSERKMSKEAAQEKNPIPMFPYPYMYHYQMSNNANADVMPFAYFPAPNGAGPYLPPFLNQNQLKTNYLWEKNNNMQNCSNNISNTNNLPLNSNNPYTFNHYISFLQNQPTTQNDFSIYKGYNPVYSTSLKREENPSNSPQYKPEAQAVNKSDEKLDWENSFGFLNSDYMKQNYYA
jgi:hypothetical protein